jgi:hypothetical protein
MMLQWGGAPKIKIPAHKTRIQQQALNTATSCAASLKTAKNSYELHTTERKATKSTQQSHRLSSTVHLKPLTR